MDKAMAMVRADHRSAFCARVGKQKPVYLVFKDHAIPTEVLGKGDNPHDAWINARDVLTCLSKHGQAFKEGDTVSILWSGGNGPFDYRVKRGKYGQLEIESFQQCHMCFVDSLEFATATVKLVTRNDQ